MKTMTRWLRVFAVVGAMVGATLVVASPAQAASCSWHDNTAYGFGGFPPLPYDWGRINGNFCDAGSTGSGTIWDLEADGRCVYAILKYDLGGGSYGYASTPTVCGNGNSLPWSHSPPSGWYWYSFQLYRT